MSYLRTPTIRGHYAYRAWDGDWYVVTRATGLATGAVYEDRAAAIAGLASGTYNR